MESWQGSPREWGQSDPGLVGALALIHPKKKSEVHTHEEFNPLDQGRLLEFGI